MAKIMHADAGGALMELLQTLERQERYGVLTECAAIVPFVFSLTLLFGRGRREKSNIVEER